MGQLYDLDCHQYTGGRLYDSSRRNINANRTRNEYDSWCCLFYCIHHKTNSSKICAEEKSREEECLCANGRNPDLDPCPNCCGAISP